MRKKMKVNKITFDREKTITLNPESSSILYDDIIEDAEIYIKNGILYAKGKKKKPGLSYYKDPPLNLDEIEDSFIVDKSYHFLKWKHRVRYVPSGWFFYKKREEWSIALNNFVIISNGINLDNLNEND